MADHHDAQDYTANGPTGVGFRTGGDGTGIKNGVVASGTEIGVHGIARPAPGDSFGRPMGVLGEGSPGVFGRGVDVGASEPPVGVIGEGHVGVRGTGASGGAGVEGLSGATGVRGFGEFVGVRGESPHGTSVVGDSDTGIGVEGHSGKGLGIHGRSDEAYGGVFTSNFAQIRLEPAATPLGPPRTGSHRSGEFFVDARGALFYCIGGSPPSWQQLAGPSVGAVSEFLSKVKKIFLSGP